MDALFNKLTVTTEKRAQTIREQREQHEREFNEKKVQAIEEAYADIISGAEAKMEKAAENGFNKTNLALFSEEKKFNGLHLTGIWHHNPELAQRITDHFNQGITDPDKKFRIVFKRIMDNAETGEKRFVIEIHWGPVKVYDGPRTAGRGTSFRGRGRGRGRGAWSGGRPSFKPDTADVAGPAAE